MVFVAFTVFELLKIFRTAVKNEPPPGLTGLKATEAVTCRVFQNNCWQMFQRKQLNSDLKMDSTINAYLGFFQPYIFKKT